MCIVYLYKSLSFIKLHNNRILLVLNHRYYDNSINSKICKAVLRRSELSV